MQLTDLISDEFVQPDLRGGTREAVIDELADLLVGGGALPAELRAAVVEAVHRREASQTTGLGAGVAIPHGVCAGLEEVVAALGIHRGEGVDFAAVDDAPVQLVVLLVVPPNLFQAHIRTLAGIARLLNDSSFRRRILAATSAEQVMDVLHAGEGALGLER